MLVEADAALGPMPSYATVRRYLRAQGLVRQRRLRPRGTPEAVPVIARREPREVRSFEVEYVHGLWHLDFHHGSHPVLTRAGAWVRPKLLGVLDDRSRLACHVQWYLDETAETLVHGLGQAIQKRAAPRALLLDCVPRNTIEVLCPPPLCGGGLHADRQGGRWQGALDT